MRKWLLYMLCIAMLLSCCACRKVVVGENDLPADGEALREAFLAKANEVTVTEDAVTFSDGSGGDPITVTACPQNTAILYASLTTLWYEAGGTVSGCLGGNSAVELYTEQIGRDITLDEGVSVLADSAQAKRWDVERIIAAHPDLIICSAAMSGYATIHGPAAAAGIPVIVMEYQDFSDYLKWFKVACHLTGHPELWESVALKVLDEVVDVILSCPDGEAPTVLSLFSGVDSLKANTSHTVVGGMISALHAVNIVDAWGMDAEHTVVNPEAVYAADPDVILIQCHTGADTARALVESLYGENPVWQSLTAVREGRVFYLEKSLFHNKPNRRFAEAYAVLAQCLYS